MTQSCQILRIDEDIRSYVSKYFTNKVDFKTWYEQRISGPVGPEQDAAQKTSKHNNTATTSYFDTLGRTFLTIADNGDSGEYKTTLELDIEGNQKAVKDALDRTVMKYIYDMLGNRINQASMDAVSPLTAEIESVPGKRWVLNDVMGKPIYNWDSRGHIIQTTYLDGLHRPTEVLLQERVPETPKLVQRFVYGESKGVELNHRGRVYEHYDEAGIVIDDAYDFKGNLLKTSREFASDYKNTLDWSGDVQLEEEIFSTTVKFDALNRPVKQITPDNRVTHFIYNEGNMLEQVEAKVQGANEFMPIVKDINYNARGQREYIEYGNGVSTIFEFDNLTFRLIHLTTLRAAEKLQNLFYTYDPVGNIMHIEDKD